MHFFNSKILKKIEKNEKLEKKYLRSEGIFFNFLKKRMHLKGLNLKTKYLFRNGWSNKKQIYVEGEGEPKKL